MTETRKDKGNSTNVASSNPIVIDAGSVALILVISVIPNVPGSHMQKLEKFNGMEFERWQQKILFYLTTLNLVRFLTEDAPALNEDETERQVVATMDTWKHFDFLKMNCTLNSLDNTLYNVYCSIQTVKQWWESLDKKYKTEDVGTKKFVVGRFLEYLMVDSKTVIFKVQELQVILYEIHAEGMSLSESFQVTAFIEKLSLSWNDFKNYLKHKRKEVTLEELIVRLRIEKNNKASEKEIGNGGFHFKAKAHAVEQGHKDKKCKYPCQNSKGGSGSLKNFKGKCYKCNKVRHRAKDCCTRQFKEHANKKPKHA